jgi:hypothetical protein
MTPEDIRTLKAAVQAERAQPAPFEIVVGGGGRPKDWQKEREHICAAGEAGATWWAEWVPPASETEMRACAARPPLWAD